MRIDNISFAYPGKPVFEAFSAEIGEGITCISARSGGGKTTLLRLIAGLETPQRGTITEVPQPVAYLFQEDRLLPWLSARDNVKAVLPAGDLNTADELLNLVELTEEADRRPGKLSGGQCRRVALARMLAVKDASLYLLDEPFKGLDDALTARLCSHLRAMGRPMIVATHSTAEIELLGGTVLNL